VRSVTGNVRPGVVEKGARQGFSVPGNRARVWTGESHLSLREAADFPTAFKTPGTQWALGPPSPLNTRVPRLPSIFDGISRTFFTVFIRYPLPYIQFLDLIWSMFPDKTIPACNGLLTWEIVRS